ncbi:MAG TPA: hypothetical protein VGF86_01950 [Candidatus Tumulicola sp.]|jgi:hypothetical protein
MAAGHVLRDCGTPRSLRPSRIVARAARRRPCLSRSQSLSHERIERRLFARLEHSAGRTYRLTINHRNDDHFDPRTDTIAWDPYSALRVGGGGRQSPALGLGHEIDHAVEARASERRLAAQACPFYDDAEERRVIRGSERHAARTLGESARHDHAGRPYRVRSPIVEAIKGKGCS